MIILGIILAIVGAFISRLLLVLGIVLILIGVILAVGHHPLY